ncbi:MAG: hypothetical protein ACLR13_10075 [Acutalibacteraceae bacterium]
MVALTFITIMMNYLLALTGSGVWYCDGYSFSYSHSVQRMLNQWYS